MVFPYLYLVPRQKTFRRRPWAGLKGRVTSPRARAERLRKRECHMQRPWVSANMVCFCEDREKFSGPKSEVQGQGVDDWAEMGQERSEGMEVKRSQGLSYQRVPSSFDM